MNLIELNATELLLAFQLSSVHFVCFIQWRNYERRSEAIASGRQAAGSAYVRRIVCFALQNSAEFLKRERS